MVNKKRHKTHKGGGILNRVRNFVWGQKIDQVAVPIDSSEVQQILLDNNEFVTPMTALSTPVPVSPPAAPRSMSFLRGLAPELAFPSLTNPPPIDEVNRIVTDFYNLLDQNRQLQKEYNFTKSLYPRDGQYRNPILDDLSFDPRSKLQNYTSMTLYNYIPDFDATNYAAKIGPKITRGGYGTIYQHASDPSRIIKEMKLKPGNFNNIHLKDNLRETFIQFYLSKCVPGSVPAIYSFARRNISEDESSFYVEMDYFSSDNGYMNLLIYLLSQPRLTFDRFKTIVTNVCNRLIQLHSVAGFVHRDFKEDNIMINTVTDDIKIIDFGMSFIRIPSNYFLANTGPYRLDATIRLQQDMGLFFIFLRQFFLSGTKKGFPTYTDPQIRGFIELIIPSSIRDRVHYLNAYNKNGTVYANANTEILKPQEIIDALEVYSLRGRIRGGRRRQRRRTHKH